MILSVHRGSIFTLMEDLATLFMLECPIKLYMLRSRSDLIGTSKNEYKEMSY